MAKRQIDNSAEKPNLRAKLKGNVTHNGHLYVAGTPASSLDLTAAQRKRLERLGIL